MDVTKYGVVLFLHLGVVIASFMVAAVLHACLHGMPRAKSVAELRPYAGFVHRLEPLLPILAVFILGFGAWLIHLSEHEFKWGDGWVIVALVTLVVVEGLSGSLLAPRTKKLVDLIGATADGDVPEAVRRAVLDPMIWDIAHLATFGFLGVVFVMADKPSGGVAAVVVIVAAAVGLGLSRWQIAMASKLTSSAAAA